MSWQHSAHKQKIKEQENPIIGMFKVRVKITNPSNPAHFFEEDFWVDTGALCSFAPKESLYLLGATALENFGVSADPITRHLKPVAAVIGGFLASRPMV